MAQWHAIDLTDFDLAPAIRTVWRTTETVATSAVEAAKDATYITVGLGVLAVNRAQTQRREFERSWRDRSGDDRSIIA